MLFIPVYLAMAIAGGISIASDVSDNTPPTEECCVHPDVAAYYETNLLWADDKQYQTMMNSVCKSD